MNCNFSIKHYEECLQRIKYSNTKNILIHDVDIWCNNINDFIELEKNYEVNALYFFRFHSLNYNILSYEVIKIIEKISNIKNINIGLHIEPFYLKDFDILLDQKNILQKIFKRPIEYYSVHEPTKFPAKYNLDSLHNNGVKRIGYGFCEGKYVSDSSSNWREGCMCNHIGKQDLTILTHTNWWYKEYAGENY
tara:strand:- start:667 stop:1242 length:576 start_codon:yes stop_codon:yes gene_type:complete